MKKQSYEVLRWAWTVTAPKASDKLILVSLADHADVHGICWPSNKETISRTQLDRKTVLAGLARLVRAGLITDTGERRGQTKQVIVWRVNDRTEMVPQTGPLPEHETVPETGPLEADSRNQTVPFFPPNGPVFPVKESRFSHGTVPKTGHGTPIEHPMNTQRNTQCAAHAENGRTDLLFPAAIRPAAASTSKAIPDTDRANVPTSTPRPAAPQAKKEGAQRPEWPKAPRRRPETQIDPAWWPDAGGQTHARTMGVTDLAAEVARFIHWNEAKDRRERNWDGAWKRWCDDVPSFSGNRTGQLSGTGGGVMGALKRIHLNSTENHDE